MTRASVLLVLAAGCAGGPAVQEPGPDAKDLLQDPARVHELFFARIASPDLYGKAHDLLTREAKAALGYEAFCLGVTQARNVVPEGFGHLVGGMRGHRVSEARGDQVLVRWCNPDLGYSREVLLRAETLGKHRFWRIDLAREDLDSMGDALRGWYALQKEAAGGQRLVYPPGWKYASAGTCRCVDEERQIKRKQS